MRFETAMRDIIRARVSRDEKRLIVETARQRGLSVSEYMRNVAAEARRRSEA
jgi:uncharacterized protein (DUF1778 family)